MEKNPTRFYGPIHVRQIVNQGGQGSLATAIFTESHYKIIHYQDCQQLIVWLPEHYSHYGNIQILNRVTYEIIFSHPVKDIVSGTTQILIDTLFIYPGAFQLSIQKNDGLLHVLLFEKYPEGQQAESQEAAKTPTEARNETPTVYKDGFGRIIPNEDLELREKSIKKTVAKITRRLEYISHAREGEVVYIEGEKKIRFYMEMGGNNCVFYLNIPPADTWESNTHFPLSEREDIINFVAEQTRRDQASSCHYTISDTAIHYFKQ